MLVFNKLAKLVEELAKHKFRHHDLTTENVLVRKDGSIKMIDYGGSWIDYEEASFSSCMDMKRWVNDIFLPFRYPPSIRENLKDKYIGTAYKYLNRECKGRYKHCREIDIDPGNKNPGEMIGEIEKLIKDSSN